MPYSITDIQLKLQAKAKAEGHADPLPIYGADGDYGTEMRDAILSYEHNHGLAQVGQPYTPAFINSPFRRGAEAYADSRNTLRKGQPDG
jgi:peptidoglycan hydrolase-like protein with peptidoglycan-binding domain